MLSVTRRTQSDGRGIVANSWDPGGRVNHAVATRFVPYMIETRHPGAQQVKMADHRLEEAYQGEMTARLGAPILQAANQPPAGAQ